MITKDKVVAFHNELDEYIKILGAKYDIKLTKSNLKYSDTEVTMSIGLETTEINLGEMKLNAFAGFNAYGRVITVNGTQYRLIGYNSRARKYPIDAVRLSDGQEFGFPARVLSQLETEVDE